MLKYRNNARLMSRAMLGRRAAADCPQKCSSSLSDSLFVQFAYLWPIRHVTLFRKSASSRISITRLCQFWAEFDRLLVRVFPTLARFLATYFDGAVSLCFRSAIGIKSAFQNPVQRATSR